jgi:hypothetical protein
MTRNGPPNYDAEARIHYGVLNANSLDGDTLDKMIMNGKTSKDAEDEETLEKIRNLLTDLLSGDRPGAVMNFIDELRGEEDVCNDGATYYFENIDGVSGHYDTNNNIVMIYKSDYYTTCRLCSPCYPNAGDLNSFDTLGVDTYSPPLDWWDGDNPPSWKDTRHVSTRKGEGVRE